MTYELVNRRTANSVSAFPTRQEAEAARVRYSEVEPGFEFDLMVVAFDEDGNVVENEVQQPDERHATARTAG